MTSVEHNYALVDENFPSFIFFHKLSSLFIDLSNCVSLFEQSSKHAALSPGVQTAQIVAGRGFA